MNVELDPETIIRNLRQENENLKYQIRHDLKSTAAA